MCVCVWACISIISRCVKCGIQYIIITHRTIIALTVGKVRKRRVSYHNNNSNDGMRIRNMQMTRKRTKDQDIVNIIIIVIICEDEQKRTMDKKRGNERYAVHPCFYHPKKRMKEQNNQQQNTEKTFNFTFITFIISLILLENPISHFNQTLTAKRENEGQGKERKKMKNESGYYFLVHFS